MATTWARIGNSPRSVVSTQTTSESAPSDAGDGMLLEDVAGFRVCFSCDAGKTFNDAASVFEAYVYSPSAGRWARSAEHDVTVGALNIGNRDFSVTFSVASPRGRIAHIANAIGVTGGALTLTYESSALSGNPS